MCLTTKDGQQAVLKICAHRVNQSFAHEAFQLELMRKIGLPVPQVYVWRIGSLDDPFSYVLMEHLDGVTLNEARQNCSAESFDYLQEHLADLVLAMHDNTADGFGRVRSDAPRHDRWVQFFREVYDPLLHDVEKSGLLPPKSRKHLHRIHERLDRVLGNADQPRLVHGDLWATNILAKCNGDGQWHVSGILDPNCKYAHAELELAYLELFHTTTHAFFKAYGKRHRLPPEYHQFRKPVYQLYSLVNHVHVFGQDYVKALIAAVDRVSSIV
jgi:fructosamine-3-kinase